MEQFRTKIQAIEQKVKDMTDPCYNFYKTRGDTDLYEKLNRQNSWDIPGFPEKERDFGANIYHHFYTMVRKELTTSIDQMGKNFAQQVKEIKNHQMWNTEVRYVKKFRKSLGFIAPLVKIGTKPQSESNGQFLFFLFLIFCCSVIFCF